MAKDFEWTFDKIDTSPTLKPVDIARVRISDTAKAYRSLKEQGMIEANVLNKALELFQQALDLLPGV